MTAPADTTLNGTEVRHRRWRSRVMKVRQEGGALGGSGDWEQRVKLGLDLIVKSGVFGTQVMGDVGDDDRALGVQTDVHAERRVVA